MNRVLAIIKYMILCFLIFLVLFLFIPKLIGWQEYIVKSGSMEPTIQKGAIVYLTDTAFEHIKQGDVIAYQNEMNIVVHRVVRVDKNYSQVQTKGDANTENDDYTIHSSMIVGKMITSIPMLGYVVQFFRSMQGIIVLLFMIMVLGFTILYNPYGKEKYEENHL